MIERLLALPVTSPITPSLSQRQIGELPVIVIDHPKVRAAVSFQGAQVLAWQPAGSEQPGLWLSENSAFTLAWLSAAGYRSAGRGSALCRPPLTVLPALCSGSSPPIMKMKKVYF